MSRSRESFLAVVTANAALDIVESDEGRRLALRRLVEDAAALLGEGASDLAAAMPARIGDAMADYGWAWNGFYVARGSDELVLGPAEGPPVCSPLTRVGGLLSSGMCFDAMALNQTLAAYEAKSWPGYVSCDGASGLTTVSSIVVPLRDPTGAPIAVWDLDASERIQPSDVRVMDVLFATLSRFLDFSPESFEVSVGVSGSGARR